MFLNSMRARPCTMELTTVSLEQSPARGRKTANAAVNDPSYTVDEFCAAERMSRSMLYKAWAEGWGPDFYWVGVRRRITQRARLKWQRDREGAAGAAGG
jgi:hypothetical protein